MHRLSAPGSADLIRPATLTAVVSASAYGHRMRFGLDIPNFGDFADVRVIADLAAAAEAGGWDGFFIWDHMALGPPTADVTVALTAIALATSRVRFGTLVTPLPRRRVHKVAREIASLDVLSGGRVVLGVGLGYPPDAEYAAFGEPATDRERAARLDESLEALIALWSGAPVDFDGAHVHVHTDGFLPTPVQQPRVPIWVAGGWPDARRAFRRAARYDGVYPIPSDMSTRYALRAEEIRAMRDAIGRTDDDFEVLVSAPPDGDPAEFVAAGATWWIQVCPGRDDAFATAAKGPPRSN
jgi:alkanesulfonate monooxygenase SsuD/methylene tetrahydromethanopterin reductase-like flavin-dependent oxidoreductase (luciferase family)